MREALVARASAAKGRQQALSPTSKTVRRSRRKLGGALRAPGAQESSRRGIKEEEQQEDEEVEEETLLEKLQYGRGVRKRASFSSSDDPPAKKVKKREEDARPPLTTVPDPTATASASASASPPPSSSRRAATKQGAAGKSSPSDLREKKLKSYALYAKQSPFPHFNHPTHSECHLALAILSKLHGPRTRPAAITAPTSRAGCGDSPSVLDALVRTILSQNTSDGNSTRAKLSMDRLYGGSDNWSAIVAGGKEKLEESIRCGGLAVVKSKVIMSILRQVQGKYGKYSLDHLHRASTEEAMEEMLSFQGVGPKTASCVLMFCLKRESFAVDTHVWRITGLLGWRPNKATREQTQAHLEVMVPDEDKYGLHVLFVNHGKKCGECKAGGKNVGKCELRRAFRREKDKAEKETGKDVEVES